MVTMLAAISCGGTDAPAKPADVIITPATCTLRSSCKFPGDKCPICGMALTAVVKRQGGGRNDSPRASLPCPQSSTTDWRDLCDSRSESAEPGHSRRRQGSLATSNGVGNWWLERRATSKKSNFLARRLGGKKQPLMVIDSPALRYGPEEFLDLLRLRDAPKPPRSAAAEDTQKHGATAPSAPHQASPTCRARLKEV